MNQSEKIINFAEAAENQLLKNVHLVKKNSRKNMKFALFAEQTKIKQKEKKRKSPKKLNNNTWKT